ncbi:lipid-A-disaccharide synthase, partial [bacterium]|nr:lipid-A-disaccharide synthase [bacterium]
CLFPFEVPLFQQAGLKTCWVGHPLVDELEEKRISESREDGVVGLFPGSRRKEVSRIFPLMLETVKVMRGRDKTPILFRTAAASERVQTMMLDLLAQSEIPEGVVEIQLGESQRLMQQVSLGVVASGTATLEAAYYGLPYCLVYRVAWPTFLMARQLIKLPHIGLINILAGREVVPEFVQNDANSYELAGWLGRYLEDENLRTKLHRELLEAASKLGVTGVHRRAADEISKLVKR